MKKSCLEGCFCSKAGFTLIELLVVVLIIGILAAVAVPQYQKAVEKSRATEAVTILSSLEKAVSVWVLENGLPSTETNFLGGSDVRNATLDIDLPCEPSDINSGDCQSSSEIANYSAECNSDGCSVTAVGGDWYFMYSQMDNTGKWYFHKCGYSGNTAKAVCDMLAAQDWDTEENWEI